VLQLLLPAGPLLLYISPELLLVAVLRYPSLLLLLRCVVDKLEADGLLPLLPLPLLPPLSACLSRK
jgi:hypothetical protein